MLAGALELAACYRYFPAGTVFLVVVDPGVGSARRGIAAETGDYRFVAPDNGVLSAVFRDTKPKRVVELTERKYARPTVSRTFEGRDRFAPAAGWLAKGIALSSLGKTIKDFRLLDLPSPKVTADEVTGEVVRVDRFGNLITNIDRRTFEHLARRRHASRSRPASRTSRAWWPPTPRRPPASCARYSAAPTTWRSRSTRVPRRARLRAARR